MDGRAPVTIVVTGKNSATTIRPCLESLASQKWPIAEIIVFDNASSDGSQEAIRDFAAGSPVPVRLVDGGEKGFICSAYNRGVDMASTDVVVLCHSDGMIPSPDELERLVGPLFADPAAACAYPRLLMPREVWNKFPFWQKFLFARAVDSTAHSNCGMFDAVRRDVYLKAGGFDEKRFTTTCGFGGEDSEATLRFTLHGRKLLTEARAIHLHSFSPSFGFRDFLRVRAHLGRTYGKQLQYQRGVREISNLLFFVKPALAAMPFAACAFFALGIAYGTCALAASVLLLFAFAFANSRRMFVSQRVLRDPRALLILPVGVFMVYYETFWFLHGLVTPPHG